MSIARLPRAAQGLRAFVVAFVASIALGMRSPAHAGEAAPPSAQRLVAEWDRSDDVARQVLVDAVAREPDARSLAAFVEVAKGSLARRDAAREKREPLEARLTALAESGAKDTAEEAARIRREIQALVDPREDRAREILRTGVGPVLDGLPDPAFDAGAPDAIRASLRGAGSDLREWVASAIGGSRKERTAPTLVRMGVEAIKEYRKGVQERAGPAKQLEEVNARIADALDRFLRAAYAKGDYSGLVPQGLVGKLDSERALLQREVAKIQSAMDEADGRRLVVRDALSRVIAGAQPPTRDRLLDLVERKVVGDADVEVSAFGVGALGRTGGERAAGLLRVALGNPDVRLAVAALDAIGDREEADAVDLLRSKLYDVRWPVRAAAAASLAKTGRGAAVPPLIEALGTARGRDLDDLALALERLTGRRYAAAAGPWKEWWARVGAGFRGPKESPPAAAGEGPAVEPDAGGTSFYGIRTHSTRVLFVLDVSGSMNFPGSERDASRKKVDVMREEVRRALTGLPDGAVFDLISFANSVRLWRKAPATRDRASLNDAIEWVTKAEVLGATNIYDALDTAFRLVGGNAAKSPEPAFDTVFFMTDGKPTSGKVTDPKLILSDVRRWNEARKVRIHVVGVGGHSKDAPPKSAAADDIDREFLTTLASENGGQCVLR